MAASRAAQEIGRLHQTLGSGHMVTAFVTVGVQVNGRQDYVASTAPPGWLAPQETALRAVYDELVRRDGLFCTRKELGRRCGMSAAFAGRTLRVLRDRGLIVLRTRRGCRGW